MIRCRHMQYLIRFSDLLFAFQDQENIIVPVMFSWGEKLFFHIQILRQIFENLKVITVKSAVTRSEVVDKMCMLTRSMQAWKNNKLVSESANCPAFKSADFFVQVCNLVHDFLSPSLITQV